MIYNGLHRDTAVRSYIARIHMHGIRFPFSPRSKVAVNPQFKGESPIPHDYNIMFTSI